MSLATWKDLCIDAVDPHALGAFWGAALGLEVEPLADGDACLTGPTPGHTIWVNRVPEAVTAKQRQHLDVFAPVEELTGLGATVVETRDRWWVLRDPEGGELCAFAGEVTSPRTVDLVTDAADPESTAAWWARLLGADLDLNAEFGAWFLTRIPECPLRAWGFMPVPEPKTVKNRVHVDVRTPDLGPLLDAGATLLRPADPPGTDGGLAWNVMADPVGNEFCAFVR